MKVRGGRAEQHACRLINNHCHGCVTLHAVAVNKGLGVERGGLSCATGVGGCAVGCAFVEEFAAGMPATVSTNQLRQATEYPSV